MSARALLFLPLVACLAPLTGLGLVGAKDTGLDGEIVDTGGLSCSTLVTRDRAFWGDRAASCVLGGSATGYALLPVSVGSGSAARTFSTPAQVRRFLAASPANLQAALGQELLVLELNLGAFPWIGDLPVIEGVSSDAANLAELHADATTVYNGGTSPQRRAMLAALTAVNAAGVAEPLWFDATCAAEPEVCDGEDNDGDGAVDEACGCV